MNSSLSRIRTLTSLQLKEKLKRSVILSRQKKLVQIIVKASMFLLITGVFYAILFLMRDVLGFTFINQIFFTFFLIVIQFTSIIACTNGLMQTLYLSRDNSILLAYPAKHHEVFISKLFVYYISEFVKSIYFIIPFLIAFGIFNQPIDPIYESMQINLGMWGIDKVFYFLNIIPFIFILPLIPVMIGAILALPIMYIKRFINKNAIVQIMLVIIIIVLAFLLMRYLVSGLPDRVAILALYNRFTTKLKNFIVLINQYGLFYNNICWLFFKKQSLLQYCLIFGLLIGGFILIILITMPTYFSIASHSSENAVNKTHKGKNKKSKNIFATFVKKETVLSLRNIGELINNYLLVFLFPFLIYFMSNVYNRMEIDNFGQNMIVAFVSFLGLFMLTSSNTASATAISEEGSEFVLLKTAPNSTFKIAWAKIFINLLFSSIVILINFVLLDIVTSLPSLNLWLMFVVFIFVNIGHIFWSFELDLKQPKLRDYATTGTNNENKNVSKSIIIGLIISTLAAVLILFLLQDDYLTGWIRIIFIAIGFMIARFVLFVSSLKVYFPRIEM